MNKYLLFNERVEVLLTDASDGNMKVVQELSPSALAQTRMNRKQALGALGLDASNTILLRVVYGQEDYCKFIALDTASSYSVSADLRVPPQDAILTSTPQLGLFLPLADCLGLVFFDPKSGALMVAHCGRHTLLQNGASKAVAFMAQQADALPHDILVWFSPSAGSGNYPLYEAGGMSLQELAVQQLSSAGVSLHHMQLSSIDTTTSAEYYSHSQGNITERFALCAKLC